MAVAHMLGGDLEKAATSLEASIKLNDKSADAFVNLGNLYAVQQRLDLAIDKLQRAVELDGGHDFEILFNLAVVQEKAGRLEDAVQTYRRAKDRNPQVSDSHIKNAMAKLAAQQASKPDR